MELWQSPEAYQKWDLVWDGKEKENEVLKICFDRTTSSQSRHADRKNNFAIVIICTSV